MSSDFMRDIAEFHEKFGLTYEGPTRALTGELGQFRQHFIGEEYDEYLSHAEVVEKLIEQRVNDRADITYHLEEQLDALVDLVYVTLGAAYLHGWNEKFKEAWNRVHERNMAKVRAERAEDSKRGSTFDVVKPPGWTPPKHTDLVEDHQHA